jgi:hypothetical protein
MEDSEMAWWSRDAGPLRRCVVAALLVFACVSMVAAQQGPRPEAKPIPGSGAQSETLVTPQFRSPSDLIAPLDTGLGQHGPPLPPPKIPPTVGSSGDVTILDSGGPHIAAANLHRHWESLGPGDDLVPSPATAVGFKHVVVVSGDDLAIYAKCGDLLFIVDLNDWFYDPNYLFDPVAFYDTHDGRYVFSILSYDGGEKQSDWIVCISDTNDAMGGWHFYRFDATLNGAIATNNYASYVPSMGFDHRGVYLTADMFDFATDTFQYAKIRILDKTEIYNLLPAGWYDFWAMYDDASTVSRAIRACKMYSYPTNAFLVDSNYWSGNYLTVWDISDPVGSPVLQGRKVTVASYAYPPDAEQPGTSDVIYTGYAQLVNAVYYANHIYTAHTVGFDLGDEYLAFFHYFKIGVEDPSIVWEQMVGTPGLYYYLPTVDVNINEDMFLLVGFSNATVLPPSLASTGRRPGDASIHMLVEHERGTGAYSGYWWGYHFGTCLDGDDLESFWSIGQFGKAGDTWGTYVAEFNFDTLPDATAPGDWNSFYTTQTSTQRPTLYVLVHDLESGLYQPTATYQYTNDGGANWFLVASPFEPMCSGEWGSVEFETFTAEEVEFDHDSMTDNRIQFSVGDMYWNFGSSPVYTVQIDSMAPQPWGTLMPPMADDQTPDLSITIRDATSGLHVTSGQYWYSRDAGSTWEGPFVPACTGSDWTTNTETMTASGVPFNQDSMTQNMIVFYIEDMFGWASWTTWLTVPVDSAPPEGWQNYTPVGVVDGGVQTCTVEVRDVTSGLDVGSAEYRWTNDNGATWSAWLPAACTGSNGTTSYETITAANVPFNHHNLEEDNLIQFRISDMLGNIAISDFSRVMIDGVALVQGHVTLADWVGDPTGMYFALTLYDGAAPIDTQETTLDSSSNYEVWFMNAGGTQMWAKPLHHLSYRQTATLLGSGSNVIDWWFPYNGDVNNDNAIDLPDLNEVLLHFGQGGPWADVDGSGIVDLPDLNFVLINFGKTGT